MGQMVKLMLTLQPPVYTQLKDVAEKRGITVQEILRAIIIPDYLYGSTKKP